MVWPCSQHGSSVMQAVVKLHSILVAAGLATVVAGCSGGYQAPIEDRSSTLERSPPLIVSNGQTAPATPRQAPVVTSSGNNTAASSTGTSSASGSPVGATTTVVRPVTISSGISSTGISRAPQPEAPLETPATSAAPATPATPATSATAAASSPPVSSPLATPPSTAPSAATTYEVAR